MPAYVLYRVCSFLRLGFHCVDGVLTHDRLFRTEELCASFQDGRSSSKRRTPCQNLQCCAKVLLQTACAEEDVNGRTRLG